MKDSRDITKIIKAADYRTEGQNAIQKAVEICTAQGGGTVLIEAGEWTSGSIHLTSHIHLQLEKGAKITFSDCPEDYLPVVFTRWEGTECYNYSPLIYARDAEDISITGEGILYGNGESWWHWKQLQQQAADDLYSAASEGIPVEERVYGTREAALRPSFIQFIDCQQVLLSDFTITDGPQWTIHPVYCENVMVRNVTVTTKGPNTDGLNPDSCKEVLIEDCKFCTGDDCVAINSGINEDGWRVGKPCQNITIRNCVMTGGHGGVVIGSAMSGGVENILMTDCQISNTMQGIRLKSMRGRGGYVKNVRIRDIRLDHITDQAIQVNMFYESSTVIPKTQTPPVFSDISMENVEGTSLGLGIQIKGLPEQKLLNLRLSNIHLQAKEAMICTDVSGLVMDQVEVTKGL